MEGDQSQCVKERAGMAFGAQGLKVLRVLGSGLHAWDSRVRFCSLGSRFNKGFRVLGFQGFRALGL